MTDYERALAFLRRLDERAAERIVPSRFGPVIVHERLSRVHDLNFLRADEPAGASAQELADEAERIQGGLGLRHRPRKIRGDARQTPDGKAASYA